MPFARITFAAICCLSLLCLFCAPVFAGKPPLISYGFPDLPWGYNLQIQRLTTTGQFPAWLGSQKGALLRNGPGRFQNLSTSHWFSGLAMINAFHFHEMADGQGSYVSFTNRYISSGEYNNSDPSHPPANPNSPNTGVTIRRVGDAVLSNGPNTMSNQFDPVTLGPIASPLVFPGNVSKTANLATSHAHIDPDGTMVHIIFNFGPSPSYQLYDIPVGTNTANLRAAKIPSNPLIKYGELSYQHSFAMTKNFVILIDQPSSWGHAGGHDFWRSFEWYGNSTVWRVVDRSSGEQVASFVSPAFFTFHNINAYEDKAGDVVVDLISYPNNTLISALYISDLVNTPQIPTALGSLGRPRRYTLPTSKLPYLQGLRAPLTVTGDVLVEYNMEMPTIKYPQLNTQPYQFFYAASFSGMDVPMWDRLLKVDIHARKVLQWKDDTATGYVGEPIFVPTPGSTAEDDGVLLSVILSELDDVPTSYLLCLDAKTMTEVARAYLPQGTVAPLGFHGKYYSLNDM